MSVTASSRREESTGRTLAYSVLDATGRAIVVGRYDNCPFPTEAELARSHGVSRTVTREAVKMLAAKGLLSARPRLGTVIEPMQAWNLFDPDVLRWLLERKFSLQLLRHFTELRYAVEPAAAMLAARAGDKALIGDIARGYERMVRAERGEDDPLAADISFHVAILQASGNPFYQQFRDLVGAALKVSIHFTNRFKGRTASLPAHKAVLDAIASGDPEAARLALSGLIAEVLELIDVAEETGAEPPPSPDLEA